MKQLGLVLLGLMFLIASACSPQFQNNEEVVQETSEGEEVATLPKYNISEDYYKTVLPFKPSEVRGLILSDVNNRFDIDELETGLMRIAQKHFSPENYVFQEGQYLDSETVRGWLNRKTDGENGNVTGLNPPISQQEEAENLQDPFVETPKYLSHVLEHNYLEQGPNGKLTLAGITIGLSLNSVYYYQVPEVGWPRETPIDDEVILEEGKRIGEEVINRLRLIEGLEEIPIVITLFKEAPRESIVPGNFFMKGAVEAGDRTIKKWEAVKEKYLLFPSQEARENQYEDAMRFLNFKERIETFFPNYIGVIGTGFYQNEELQELTIDIPVKFYGKSEIIAFTEYTLEQIIDHFPPYINLQVYISSIDGPESLIVRSDGEQEPYVHIYK